MGLGRCVGDICNWGTIWGRALLLHLLSHSFEGERSCDTRGTERACLSHVYTYFSNFSNFFKLAKAALSSLNATLHAHRVGSHRTTLARVVVARAPHGVCYLRLPPVGVGKGARGLTNDETRKVKSCMLR